MRSCSVEPLAYWSYIRDLTAAAAPLIFVVFEGMSELFSIAPKDASSRILGAQIPAEFYRFIFPASSP